VHTQQIGRLGWFDRWFCAPSNHRVHHAVNDCYLDRNFGGIFIVWDRLFGSYQPELDSEPCVYGTRKPLSSWNPLWANLEIYADLLRTSWHAGCWSDKLRVWFKPPGWQPADVAARFPKPAFDLRQVQRFEPVASRAALSTAALLFVLLLLATLVFLWVAHTMPLAHRIAAIGALVSGLWIVGALCEMRAVAPAES